MSEENQDNLEPFDPSVHRWPVGSQYNPTHAADCLRRAAAELRRSGSQAKRYSASKAAGGATPMDALWNDDLKEKLSNLKKTLNQNAYRTGNYKSINDDLADDCSALANEFDSIAMENDDRPERKALP